MQKSASQNAKVRVFFNNLSAIPVFFFQIHLIVVIFCKRL
nr:unnamed protein product [Callosobruchus chinensis]